MKLRAFVRVDSDDEAQNCFETSRKIIQPWTNLASIHLIIYREPGMSLLRAYVMLAIG